MKRHSVYVLALLALLVGLPALAAPLGPQEPSDEEQLGIYEINRARSDPPAYGDEIELDLSGVVARPALAVNRYLTGSARFHSQEMLEYDYFDHVSQVTGDGPNQMAEDNGYDLFGMGLGKDWGADNNIESIALKSGSGLIVEDHFPDAVERLIVDDGVPTLGHRRHLLAIDEFWTTMTEIGCGEARQVLTGGPRSFTYLYTVHTGNDGTGTHFLTGVVYDDANLNGRYDLGEGLSGVTVSTEAFLTTTMTAGGWSLAVPDGSYTVTASGGPFVGTATATATVAGRNVEVDFRSGAADGEVDFENQFGGFVPPTAPVVSIGTSTTSGMAPLTVDFTGSSTNEETVLSWSFGDGGTDDGANPSHTFDDPGIYAVTLTGTDAGGTASAAALVVVGGPAGAGPGTVPPASDLLEGTKVKAKANFAKSGKDLVKLTATFEMPAGFVPGEREIQVAFGGVTSVLGLTAKNRAVDAGKNKVTLKFKKQKGGAPLPAGVVAKLSVTLKGDRAASLMALGMTDEDGVKTVRDVPIALLLGELPYRGTVDLTVKGKAGKKSTAKLLK